MSKMKKEAKLTTKQSGRKFKDAMVYTLIGAMTTLVIAALVGILGWVFYNGIGSITPDFLFGDTTPKSVFVHFEEGQEYNFDYEITVDDEVTAVNITDVQNQGELLNNNGDEIELKPGTEITKIDGTDISELGSKDATTEVEKLMEPTTDLKVKLTVPGGGILPLILTTMFVVVFAILIAVPIGLFAAIYLVEYNVPPKLNKGIHFAIDTLAGIPSIIFGLFGVVFFSQTLQLGQTLIAGILTVVLMLLPTIIKAIEEALITVPESYREASLGLGANKSQTLFKVVIPGATPGIVVAIILAMGRVIGESAIFVFVVGTVAAFPTFLGKGATLSVYAYAITRESLDIKQAAAIGVVIIVMILALNLTAKLISNRIGRTK